LAEIARNTDSAVPDNISLIKLPPCAPALNPIENVWQDLRATKRAIIVFDTYADIVDKCCDAWNFFANEPTKIPSITLRCCAQVRVQGRWYEVFQDVLQHPRSRRWNAA
jgi:hypothetical protein